MTLQSGGRRGGSLYYFLEHQAEKMARTKSTPVRRTPTGKHRWAGTCYDWGTNKRNRAYCVRYKGAKHFGRTKGPRAGTCWEWAKNKRGHDYCVRYAGAKRFQRLD